MADGWESRLERWRQAGLIDPAGVEAILAWERAQPGRRRLRVPVLVAVALGGVLVAAGLLLFVSTHWQALGPGQRFGLLLALVVGLHGGGAALENRFPPLAVSLHGVGTVTLGAGLFLAGQLFHLEAHWPLGLLLWAIGAGLGWALLRQWPQLALLALLGPAWLVAEWQRAVDAATEGLQRGSGDPTVVLAPAAGLLLLSLCYLAAPAGAGAVPAPRRVLLWLGGLGLLPTGLLWQLFSHGGPTSAPLPLPLAAVGWAVALGAPLLLGLRLRGRRAWPLAVAIGWLLPGVALAWSTHQDAGVFPYLWWAVGGLLLVAWGVMEGRSERVNLGAALIAIDVLAFYVSQVMDSLGRSASLIGLGVLFLGGGWGLELLRRRLVARAVGRGTP
ncbi:MULTISPECIES: DUF2157 domain-containing protein [Cyanophyceae]|uniref:DUF2157 domain-containing protein n=1 Tax=Aphanothece cf. minutissima CCALA 015 TaxID=2107695 RepID=A0ABX5FBM0_9CHRO|nr:MULTISPECIES: DUF2157 domain-containing protein [Cyanophyceae]MCP9797851.1 DUF2157 domain-containing protein [Cyanobium sp. Lug-B]PSB39308.1 DUF2157 domain-containing protein [Aphanothece cf. minutissima CCALA 015]